MKSTVLFLIASLAFAQGQRGPGGPGFGRGPGMFGGGGPQQALVTGAPYSAVSVVQSQEVLADGNRITNSRSTSVARDGQGRIRTEETVKPPAASGKPAYTLTTILDYVGGNRYLLDSSTMTAYQSPLRTPRGMMGQRPMRAPRLRVRPGTAPPSP